MSQTTITKLRQARKGRQWSQQELGFFARVGVADVSRIESGRMKPYPLQAEKIARALNLKPDELQDEVQVDK
jgi:transcriptional regulator with XRE-family HTH domain